MKYTFIVEYIVCEYGDYEFLAKYEEGHGGTLTHGYLKEELIGYGLSELDAIMDLLLLTKEKI